MHSTSFHSLHQHDFCLTELHLGHDSVVAHDHVWVRLLGAGRGRTRISSDLSLDRLVSSVSVSGFYWLRQLHCCRRSLDTQSAATLVHSFVSSRIDYCNALLAGALKMTTDKLHTFIYLHTIRGEWPKPPSAEAAAWAQCASLS